MIIAGAANIAFGLVPLFYFAAAAVFLDAAMMPILNAHSQSIWQTQTPKEMQGRVFSVRRVIAQCTFPVGTLVAGVTGGVFNPGHVIAVAGTLLAIFCTAQLFNPALLRVEDKQWLDTLAESRTSVL
jgi:hypothetical protein